MNSYDSEKTQKTTGIHSGPGYTCRVWTNTELSECFTKLVLRLFSCAVDGLQTLFLNFPLKLNFFSKLNFFPKLNFFHSKEEKTNTPDANRFFNCMRPNCAHHQGYLMR